MLHKEGSTEPFDASGMRVGIVQARFNQEITDALVASARDALARYGIREEDSTLVTVAGAMELPFALQRLAAAGTYDALVAIGCIIRGETPHFDYVAKTAQEGVLRVSLDERIPIGFGVLTTEDEAQARARTHVGGDAAIAALELAHRAR